MRLVNWLLLITTALLRLGISTKSCEKVAVVVSGASSSPTDCTFRTVATLAGKRPILRLFELLLSAAGGCSETGSSSW